MTNLDRLETDLYNEIMEMRAKEKKREEDRENTIKTVKFIAIIGMYVIAFILALSLLLIFLKYQFPEYFTATHFPKSKKTIYESTDKNSTVSNVHPVSQNVIIHIYNNGVLSAVPVKTHKEGNNTVVNIGKPSDSKKTIEALKNEILNDKSLTEKEKKKKILDLFSTKPIKYGGKFANDKKKSMRCNNAVVDSVNADNRALRAYEQKNLDALSKAIEVAAQKTEYSDKVCKKIMSDTQWKDNVKTGKEHLKLLRRYASTLKLIDNN